VAAVGERNTGGEGVSARGLEGKKRAVAAAAGKRNTGGEGVAARGLEEKYVVRR